MATKLSEKEVSRRAAAIYQRIQASMTLRPLSDPHTSAPREPTVASRDFVRRLVERLQPYWKRRRPCRVVARITRGTWSLLQSHNAAMTIRSVHTSRGARYAHAARTVSLHRHGCRLIL